MTHAALLAPLDPHAAAALAWPRANQVAVVPAEFDWRLPLGDAGYVVIANVFDTILEDLAAVADPSDETVWTLVEPHIVSRDAHYRACRAARA